MTDKLVSLVKQFEGCKLKAYPDPGSGGDPWTIGYGSTGTDIVPGLTWTQDQAEQRLRSDLEHYASVVSRFVAGSKATQNQLDALTSFAYNVSGWRSSTLFRLVQAGKFHEAADEFPKWCHASGRVLPGLVKRREAERELFLSKE